MSERDTALTPAAEEEGESCPLCGALPIDQVDSHAVEEHVRNRYKFSRQGLLDDCASREAAQRIVEWADNGKLADDEWLVERNETAIIAICRALLSSPRVEEVRREVFEEAAARLEVLAIDYEERAEVSAADKHYSTAAYQKREADTLLIAATLIRSRSPQGG